MKKIQAMMFALLGMCALLAHASNDNAAVLEHYPSAQQVQDDLLASAQDADPEEVAGRQAGRLMMLHNALAHTWSSSGNISQAPPQARELLDSYSQAYRAISEREQSQPYWREKCGYFTNLFDSCRRKHFTWEQDYFKNSPQAASEVANLYFPPQHRENFIDLTGVGGSRQRFAEYQKDRHEAGRGDRNRDFRKRLPWLLGGLSLFPLALGFAFIALAWRMGKRLNRYEFDHTSPGGVVEFANFEASQSHERKRILQRLCANAGYLIFMVGVLGFGLAIGIAVANA